MCTGAPGEARLPSACCVHGAAGEAIIVEEGHTVPQLVHILHLIVQHFRVGTRTHFQVILHVTHPMGPKSPGSRASSYVENIDRKSVV